MPLQICPKCKKFHYVPGECPTPRVGTIAHVAHGKTSLTAAITKVLVENPGILTPVEVEPPKRGRPKMDGPSTGKSKRAEYQRDLMRKRITEGKVKPRKKP